MVDAQADENHRQRDAVVERPKVRVVETMNDGEVRRYPVPIACASRDASQVPDDGADRHHSASFPLSANEEQDDEWERNGRLKQRRADGSSEKSTAEGTRSAGNRYADQEKP